LDDLGLDFRNPPDLKGFADRKDHRRQVHPLQVRSNPQIMSEWKRHFDAKAAWLGTLGTW